MKHNAMLNVYADTDFIEVYSGLSEDEYKSFKHNPMDFWGERIYFFSPSNTRNLKLISSSTERKLNINFLRDINPYNEDTYDCFDEDDYDDGETLSSEEEQNKQMKALCQDIIAHLNERRPFINKIQNDTFTIISRFHNIKEHNLYELGISLEDFREEKLHFIQDDGLLCCQYGKYIFDSDNDDDLYACSDIVYDNNIIGLSQQENEGAFFVSCYAFKFNSNGDIMQVLHLKLDDSGEVLLEN